MGVSLHTRSIRGRYAPALGDGSERDGSLGDADLVNASRAPGESVMRRDDYMQPAADTQAR
jgi:hypothetical protein